MIEANTTSSDLHGKLADLGAKGLQKVLVQVEQSSLVAEEQNEKLVTYAAKVEKSEATLDWSSSAIELDRKIRGLNSWPVAQTLFKGKVLRIWRAECYESESDLSAGIVRLQGKKMTVGTGDGVIDLLEVQLPGGKRLGIQSFLNSHEVDGITLGEGN